MFFLFYLLIRKMDKKEAVEELKKVIHEYRVQHGINRYELVDLVMGEEVLEDVIPVCIFDKRISCFEAIVKYLRDNKSLSLNDIASLINRSKSTVATTYANAKRKMSIRFDVKSSEHDLPISILADRKFSVNEVLIKYLREKSCLRFSEIGKLIERDQRTVWTVYNRAKFK